MADERTTIGGISQAPVTPEPQTQTITQTPASETPSALAQATARGINKQDMGPSLMNTPTGTFTTQNF